MSSKHGCLIGSILIATALFITPQLAIAQDTGQTDCLNVRNSITAGCLSQRAPGNWIKKAIGGGYDITDPAPEPHKLRTALVLGVLNQFFNVVDQFIAVLQTQIGNLNNPPTAVATATPTSGTAPLTVQFDGTGSSDPDTGDTLTYEWDYGDGTSTDTTAEASHTYESAGTYTATLTVTDSSGATDSTTVTITVDAAAGS